MRTPGSTASAVCLRLAAAHLAALETEAAARPLIGPIRLATERLREAGQRRQRTWEAATAQLARRERADFEADRLLRQIYGHTLAVSGQDSSQQPCRDVFPDGLAVIQTAPAAEQPAVLAALEHRLEGAGELGQHRVPLHEARTRLEAALRAHVEAVRADAEAIAELELAKTEWRHQYRASFEALVTVLGDRARAESFFVQTRAGDSAGSSEGSGSGPG